MAQTGYTPIQLYYSTTASATPSAGNLANGELAINITDGKLYYKDNGGTVQLLAQTGTTSNVASISFGSTGLTPSTATTGAVTVAGTLATGNGGTGLTTFTAANNAIYSTSSSALTAGTLPVAAGGTGQTTYTNGQLLIGNTTGNTLTKATLTAGSGIAITNGNGSITIAATGGSGDVVGPASATDNAIARFDGTTGKLIQNSAVTIDDTTGSMTFTGSSARIRGDFSGIINSSAGLFFQNSSTNSDTYLTTIPTSSSFGMTSGYQAYNSSDVNNSSYARFTIKSDQLLIQSASLGTGTDLPMVFAISSAERLRITANGGIAFSGSTDYGTTGQVLQSNGNASPTWVPRNSFTTTATAGGTTTLTNTSNLYQVFTGVSGQTIQLPVTSTLFQGWQFNIVNNSTNNLTVTSSGGNFVITVLPGTAVRVTCVLTTGTTAASWEAGYTDFSTATGTGAVVLGTSPTLSGPTINDGYTEEVFAVTDAAGVALSPTNGSIQTWTLGASRTPTAGTWAAGQSMTLMIDDGTAYTVTWTTLNVVWETDNGSAPTLATSGFTVIVLWKVGTQIYGARVGNA